MKVIPSIEQFFCWVVVKRCTISKLPSEWNVGAPGFTCFGVVSIIDLGWLSSVRIDHIHNSTGNKGIPCKAKKTDRQNKYTQLNLSLIENIFPSADSWGSRKTHFSQLRSSLL